MTRKTIGLEQLDGFSIDEETSQLYWRGNAVVTVTSLPWWVQVSALAAATATAVSALTGVVALCLRVAGAI